MADSEQPAQQINWKKNFAGNWVDRAAFVAKAVPPNSRVLDLGCGGMDIERFLPGGCTYLPCDCVARDQRTIVCDFNLDQFPDDADCDVVTVLGCLEYLHRPRAFFARVGAMQRPVLLTYHTRDNTAGVRFDEVAGGGGMKWANHLTDSELQEVALEAGLVTVNTWRVDALQSLYLLVPVGRLQDAVAAPAP